MEDANGQYRFKSSDVKQVVEAPSVQIGYHGLALKIAGQHDLRLEFRFKASRAEVRLLPRPRISLIIRLSSTSRPSLMPLESRKLLNPNKPAPNHHPPHRTSTPFTVFYPPQLATLPKCQTGLIQPISWPHPKKRCSRLALGPMKPWHTCHL